ncbi:unnamed protein product [Discosporangium mesarthrocarpum]
MKTPYHEADGDYRKEKWMEGPPTPPLFQLQHGLPRLPVPTLEETCAKYLLTLKALLPDRYDKAEADVKEFIKSGGIGERLQARLVRRAKDRGDSSWLAEWWNKLGYLLDRGPTVFFVSYFFHFKDSPHERDRSQVGRAASLLHAALTFRRSVITGQLPPEKTGRKKSPLCSTAYKYM